MYNQLTREQRYAIYPGLQEGKSYTAIARLIKRSVSTASREVKRNTNRHGRYIFREAVERNGTQGAQPLKPTHPDAYPQGGHGSAN